MAGTACAASSPQKAVAVTLPKRYGDVLFPVVPNSNPSGASLCLSLSCMRCCPSWCSRCTSPRSSILPASVAWCSNLLNLEKRTHSVPRGPLTHVHLAILDGQSTAAVSLHIMFTTTGPSDSPGGSRDLTPTAPTTAAGPLLPPSTNATVGGADERVAALSTQAYLEKTVMGVLALALEDVCRVRPSDPIDYLGSYLLRRSSANNTVEVTYDDTVPKPVRTNDDNA